MLRMNARGIVRAVVLALSAVRLLPHVCVLFATNNPALFADIRRWTSLTLPAAPRRSKPGAVLLAFLEFMTDLPEFRNLFYYRTGVAGKLFRFLCPPMATLYLLAERIGPGLFIQHGFATIVDATEIGANCWINQQVTIGFSSAHGVPKIGDNVTVGAGAKVLGGITIGSNARIGANAVVVKNVPGNVTVVGVPARIVRRDGRRVDETL